MSFLPHNLKKARENGVVKAVESIGKNNVTSVTSAKKVSGSVSVSNGKMPGTSLGMDPFSCNVGDKLAGVSGSVCSGCYARRLVAPRPAVLQGYSRAQTLAENQERETWIKGIMVQITAFQNKGEERFHRWMDSGDIPSSEVLDRIVEVATRMPETKFWLPTRELGIVREYLGSGGKFPSNLVVRLSSAMVGDKPRKVLGLKTSTVHKKGGKNYGYECPASNQGNQCGECRACWDPSVKNVSYPKH